MWWENARRMVSMAKSLARLESERALGGCCPGLLGVEGGAQGRLSLVAP